MEISAEHKIRMDEERAEHIRWWARFVSFRYIIPLFLLFGVADYIWYPHLMKEFFLIRIATVVCVFLSCELVRRQKTLRGSQLAAVCVVSSCTVPLNLMIYLTGDPGTPYYAGLILTTVGVAAGLRFTWRYYAIASLATLIPIAATGIVLGANFQSAFVLNFLFLVSVTLIMTVSMFFNEKLHIQEYQGRIALENEVLHRDGIIESKTKEAIRLEGMSRQFSPQVLESIKTGGLRIDQQVHRSRICAIFIDIVNSTERVTRIDKDKVHKVIAMFMEDTIKTLLKYDLTVDKFLGDGILAFCNDPVEYTDYAHRTVSAALEIKEKIGKRQYIYENYWLNELQIRIGIADGFANVGFYGSDKYFHAYTAIGPVINLASRLCGAAEPNQILATFDVIEQIDIDAFEWENAGKKTLKGFEQDLIKTYSIKGHKGKAANVHHDSPECTKCGSLMFLDTGADGIYVFKCRSCGTVAGDSSTPQAA